MSRITPSLVFLALLITIYFTKPSNNDHWIELDSTIASLDLESIQKSSQIKQTEPRNQIEVDDQPFTSSIDSDRVNRHFNGIIYSLDFLRTYKIVFVTKEIPEIDFVHSEDGAYTKDEKYQVKVYRIRRVFPRLKNLVRNLARRWG
ncbi:686_t:CDS:1 [Acaulospora morrowiae]|uniref:686_t:CDS:1 n=1 Tax=Acaulospora morrowiae TaxID=94023 RepID=A0A9N9H2G7_9GLOM|nr:686_t:CDS:1 [Acaulospora morrowiae]